ncbi:PREDICTED: hsp70-Hsp90 organizing protein 1-like [Camelina sativa]|uniref:Hsp70-Hsp90 organizing protein 1-like n=1 Tax=Camelina sativa TaxID=90675 RepID=A0ABM0WU47_CAMSA|nr:PREDICTED: hsp70-Hsp90 organizing protein 1-like [Camelina sativa]
MAEESKAKGNASFSSGDFTSAILHFTEAINLSPTDHVLYSNRSAAHASLHHYADALSDANETIKLKPYWPEGYSRLGAAHLGLNQFDLAVTAYKKGLDIDPTDEELKSGLADAEASVSRSKSAPPPNPFGDAFKGPEMWSKLTADPSTRAFLQQPDFVGMMQEIQKNPSNLNLYLKDQRVMPSLGVLSNVNFRPPPPNPPGDDSESEVLHSYMGQSSRKVPGVKKKREPEPLVTEEKEKKERKERAKKENELGNAAFTKKEFAVAIEHYCKAIEIDDEDISYITNRAAVYLELGEYDECIKDCDEAVGRGRELSLDYKMVAKALTRKGTALTKMVNCSKDYEPAIEAFQKALTEYRNSDTLERLYKAERAKKEWEQKEYFDPKIGDEEREKGNDFFKEQKYPDAILHYTEAIKRNPKDPKGYSNRAACYIKLGAMADGQKDAEKCIEIDPTFSEGYSRKAAVQFFLKEYQDAMKTYQQGLKHDPNNQELLDGVSRCVQQINNANRGDLTPVELKERQAKAMQDPEIQNILTDSVMRQVLTDVQENSSAAQRHMQNPMVMNKIQKLISAGIVQMK